MPLEHMDKEDIDTIIGAFGRATTETEIPRQVRQDAIDLVKKFLFHVRDLAPEADPRT